MEPTPPAMEDKVLTTGPAGNPQHLDWFRKLCWDSTDMESMWVSGVQHGTLIQEYTVKLLPQEGWHLRRLRELTFLAAGGDSREDVPSHWLSRRWQVYSVALLGAGPRRRIRSSEFTHSLTGTRCPWTSISSFPWPPGPWKPPSHSLFLSSASSDSTHRSWHTALFFLCAVCLS